MIPACPCGCGPAHRGRRQGRAAGANQRLGRVNTHHQDKVVIPVPRVGTSLGVIRGIGPVAWLARLLLRCGGMLWVTLPFGLVGAVLVTGCTLDVPVGPSAGGAPAGAGGSPVGPEAEELPTEGASGGANAGVGGEGTPGIPTGSRAPSAGTGGDGALVIPLDPEPTLTELQPVARYDLSLQLKQPPSLVGVSRDPEGRLYVLDENVGIYELQEGGAVLIYALGDSLLEERERPASGFTDLAALGASRFALTAINDGFLLDLAARSMWRHFCYLPPTVPGVSPTETSLSVGYELQGIAVWQRTDALAYDLETDTLWAQPQTFAVESQALVGTELASFELLTGTPLSFSRFVDREMQAGGLAITAREIWLGEGSRLLSLDRRSGAIGATYVLQGIEEVSGLFAEPDGSLLVVAAGQGVIFGVRPPVPQ